MSQTRAHSAWETAANTVIGWIVSFSLWPLFLTPVFGIPMSTGENLTVTLVFTVASLARSYACRRFFNQFHKRS